MEAADLGLRHRPPERNVPRLGRNRMHVLELVCDAEQLRAMPGAARVEKLKASIVVTTAHADSQPAVVERDERRQHEIEPSRVDALLAVGLEDAEEVRAEIAVVSQLREAHRPTRDDRRIDALAGARGFLGDPTQRRLAVEREKNCDAAGTAKYVEVTDPRRYRAVGRRAFGGRQRAPLGPDPLTQTAPLGLRVGGDAPRLCRHEPLLSNRSNKWGTSWRLKAFRLDRICTTPPTELTPDA